MNFSALSSFSGTQLWFYGAIGILFLFIGLWLYRLASLKLPLRSTVLATLRSQAEYWQVPEAALADVAYSQLFFASLLTVGLGLGSLIFAMIYALLLISPMWNLICPFDFGYFIINIWFLALIIGGCVGGFYALHYLRREACATRTDGPRRHLRDYRSPLFLLIPGIWFVLFCVSVFAFHPSYSPVNRCLDNDFLPRPWQGWIVYPWLAFAFVALLSLETLLSLFARTGSPLVPSSVPDVIGVDDMFRGKIISTVQYMIIVQIVLFSTEFPVVASKPYSMIAIIIILGLLLLFTPSGLGGKLTGWKRKRVA